MENMVASSGMDNMNGDDDDDDDDDDNFSENPRARDTVLVQSDAVRIGRRRLLTAPEYLLTV
jgi:hypothetical protein